MTEKPHFWQVLSVLRRRPDARAILTGDNDHPALNGIVRFYQTDLGVLIAAEVSGLPQRDEPCGEDFFGFHIHGGRSCSGNENDPFANALTHYNPEQCPHPAHAGDLPPLLSNAGRAFSVFLTDRFTLRDVLGRTVIIHARPDDFSTQPGGNVGSKIACGEICSGRRC